MKDKKSILVSETTHTNLKLYCEKKGQKIGFGANFILSLYLEDLSDDISQMNLTDNLTEKCIMINRITHSKLKEFCGKHGKKVGVVVDYIINHHITKKK